MGIKIYDTEYHILVHCNIDFSLTMQCKHFQIARAISAVSQPLEINYYTDHVTTPCIDFVTRHLGLSLTKLLPSYIRTVPVVLDTAGDSTAGDSIAVNNFSQEALGSISSHFSSILLQQHLALLG